MWQLVLWNKQWKARRRSEVQTRVGKILFCKNTENAVKINKSPRFTGIRCKKQAVNFFFHRISYENSPPKLDPGSLDMDAQEVYA